MKTTSSRSAPAHGAKNNGRKAGVALRTGKLHVSKASATHIRAVVGVTHLDELRAARALTYATAKSKPPVAKSAKSISRAAASRAWSTKR